MRMLIALAITLLAAVPPAAAQLYQMHNDGKIWKYTGTPCAGASCGGWQALDRNAATTAIAAGSNALGFDTLYQIHGATGLIWQYTGTACTASACPGWGASTTMPRAGRS